MTKQLSDLVVNLDSYCRSKAKIRTRDVPDKMHLKDILRMAHELHHHQVFVDTADRRLRTILPVSANKLHQKQGQPVPFAKSNCYISAGFDDAPDYLAKSSVLLSCPTPPPSAQQPVAEVPCSSTGTASPADHSAASGEASCSTANTAVQPKPKPKETATQLKEREKEAKKAHVLHVFAVEESLQGKEKLLRPYLHPAAQEGGLTFGGPTRNLEPTHAHTLEEPLDPFEALGARHEQEMSQQEPVGVAMGETPCKLGTKDMQVKLSQLEQGRTRERLKAIEGGPVTVNRVSQAAKRRMASTLIGPDGKFKSRKT